MVTEPNEGAAYLKLHPYFWKWMNRCAACGFLGYRPEMPDTSKYAIIRRHFSSLPLDGLGRCDQCAGSSEGDGR